MAERTTANPDSAGEQGAKLVRFVGEDVLELLQDISGPIARAEVGPPNPLPELKRHDRLCGGSNPVPSTGPSDGALEQFAARLPGHVDWFEFHRGRRIDAEEPEQRTSHCHRISIQLLVEEDLDAVGAKGLQERC